MSNEEFAEFNAVLKTAKDWPRVDTGDKKFTYGTAGFRMKAELLDYVCFCVGIIASLRSRKCNGHCIGVMITASHNPAEDNGVKIVDPMGEMMDAEWEYYATRLANATNEEELQKEFVRSVIGLKVDQEKSRMVIFAKDTRPSGARLVKALTAALDATGTKYVDYGYATTPQLHYLVRAENTQHSDRPYGEVSEEGYYKKLSDAFSRAMQYAQANGPVTVDCANGVGAPKLKELIKYLPEDKLKIIIENDAIEDASLLNKAAGADFVKTQQRAPIGSEIQEYSRWCSLDGDADRLIYYFLSEHKQFHMLDGDRIATLAASFIGDLVRKSGLEEHIKLAVVQTAYANGSSTKYVEGTLKLKVEFTSTGVKHLHHAAARYDVGVYFEANGHGTVLFSDRALKAMRKHQPESPAQLEALETLRALSDLINQTVGDALSDMLLVECILAHKQWSVSDWAQTYTDLPNKLARVVVSDRAKYKTVEGSAERRLETPKNMQGWIDEIVAKYRDARAFVRASGTEDAVRVYGEAAESYDVDDMVERITKLLH